LLDVLKPLPAWCSFEGSIKGTQIESSQFNVLSDSCTISFGDLSMSLSPTSLSPSVMVGSLVGSKRLANGFDVDAVLDE
jgi:hypothetical protein